jgi:hypothetical protein
VNVREVYFVISAADAAVLGVESIELSFIRRELLFKSPSSLVVTRREIQLWECFIEPTIQLFIAHPKGDPLSLSGPFIFQATAGNGGTVE